mgnify:CR=1 FL=1
MRQHKIHNLMWKIDAIVEGQLNRDLEGEQNAEDINNEE